MRTHRFYFPGELPDLLHVSDSALVHQWRRVLRILEGQEVRLFDGRGKERTYRVAEYTKDHGASLAFVREELARFPTHSVTLFFALLKKEKSEWVIQKGTELGATRFVPVISDRTEKTGCSLERMRKIAIEAAEQCGRSDIPEITSPASLRSVLEQYKGEMTLVVCHEGGGRDVRANVAGPVGCLVGPEGGWSDAEIELFSSSGIPLVSLGEFTLRAETACIAAVLLFSTRPEETHS